MNLALQPLSTRLHATLAFFDLFDTPLSLEQLTFYTPGSTPSPKEILEATQKDDKIFLIKGFFSLRKETVEKWNQQQEIKKKYWGKVNNYLPILQRLPFMKTIAVCNTLAFGSANAKSDIDLFIITTANRIFSARVIITLVTWLLGIRRHGKKIAGRFCLSFFIAEDALNLEKILLNSSETSGVSPYSETSKVSPYSVTSGVLQNSETSKALPVTETPNILPYTETSGDIYMAYWMRTLRPLVGMETFETFLAANTWLQKFFPESSYKTFLSNRSAKSSSSYKTKTWGLGGNFGNYLEKKLQNLHEKRFRQKISDLGPEASVIISPEMLKFHNIDRRKEFNQKFWQKIKESH